MSGAADRSEVRAAGPDDAGQRPWWVSRLSRERERHIYFMVTVVAAAWYLLTHIL